MTILLIILWMLFKPNNEIYYFQNVLSSDEFRQVVDKCRSLRLTKEENPYVQNRFFSPIKSIDDILFSTNIKQKLEQAFHRSIKPSHDIPVEFRLYLLGSHMDWHRDDILYFPPQYECILTLENTSDSYTEYIDRSGRIQSIYTEPNSLLIVRANGVKHRVTEITQGHRSIVKFVYATSPSFLAYGLS